MKRRWVGLWIMLMSVVGVFGQGQTPHLLDPMKRALVEPVMALHYADAIGLSKGQRTYIESQIREAEAKFRSLDASLQRERRAMEQVLSRPGATEKETLEHLDRLLDVEREIKRVNMACSVRVRNQLTPAQREQLLSLKVPPPPPPPPPPHAPAAPPVPPVDPRY